MAYMLKHLNFEPELFVDKSQRFVIFNLHNIIICCLHCYLTDCMFLCLIQISACTRVDNTHKVRHGKMAASTAVSVLMLTLVDTSVSKGETKTHKDLNCCYRACELYHPKI